MKRGHVSLRLMRAKKGISSTVKLHSTTICLFLGTDSSSFPMRRFRGRMDASPAEQEGLGNPVSSQSDVLLQAAGALLDVL